VGYLEQALEALQHLPADRTTVEQAVDVRYDLAVALEPLGQYAQALPHLREAETLAAGLADHHRLGRIYRRIAGACRMLQDYELALAYCQRAHAVATALGDVDTQMQVNHAMGMIAFDLGDYRQAMASLQQILTAVQGEQGGQSSGSVVFPAFQARVWMSRCLSELGEFADALAYGTEAIQIAEAGGRPIERLAVYSHVGPLQVRQGTLHTAIPLLEGTVVLSQNVDMPNYYHLAAPWLALAYALAGRTTDARAVLEQLGRTTDTLIRALACGEAYLLVGDVEEAHRLAQRVLTDARHNKGRGWEAWALWLLGESARHRDPPDVTSAEASYQQALALAKELGMRPIQAHCHRGLGTLYAASGRREQARIALAIAIALYGAMDMVFWLRRADAVLAQIE
jgi:tetratricopeptide (TPR) repeat protein